MPTKQDINGAIRAATDNACKELDKVFPGFDAGGISSEFHHALACVIRRMLAGDNMGQMVALRDLTGGMDYARTNDNQR